MRKRAIPAIIRQDFARKLLALLLAIVIWYAVSSEIQKQLQIAGIRVKLDYDPNAVAVEEPPYAVTLTFRGAKAKLDAIDPGKLEVEIRVPEPKPNVFVYEVEIGKRHVKVPRGTRFLSASPPKLKLKVDRIIEKPLPVEVRESGKLAPNYQVLKRQIIPATATVRGPSRQVEALTAISTKPLPLDNSVTDSFQMKELELVAIPGLTISPSKVSVSYEIARDDNSRKFENIPVRVLNGFPPALTLDAPLAPVTVLLRGPKSALAALKPENIHAFVDLTNLAKAGPAELKIAVRVDSPIHFAVEGFTPSTVAATLKPVPESAGSTSPPTSPAAPPAAPEAPPRPPAPAEEPK